MKGLVLTRRVGESIRFFDKDGRSIGSIRIVDSDHSRVLVQLIFSSHIAIARGEIPVKGERLDKRA